MFSLSTLPPLAVPVRTVLATSRLLLGVGTTRACARSPRRPGLWSAPATLRLGLDTDRSCDAETVLVHVVVRVPLQVIEPLVLGCLEAGVEAVELGFAVEKVRHERGRLLLPAFLLADRA